MCEVTPEMTAAGISYIDELWRAYRDIEACMQDEEIIAELYRRMAQARQVPCLPQLEITSPEF